MKNILVSMIATIVFVSLPSTAAESKTRSTSSTTSQLAAFLGTTCPTPPPSPRHESAKQERSFTLGGLAAAMQDKKSSDTTKQTLIRIAQDAAPRTPYNSPTNAK